MVINHHEKIFTRLSQLTFIICRESTSIYIFLPYEYEVIWASKFRVWVYSFPYFPIKFLTGIPFLQYKME